MCLDIYVGEHQSHGMKTTVEITSEQRAKLMALAASRKEKGLSRLVQEALDEYLDSRLENALKVERALQLKGVLDTDDAAEFEKNCQALREQWR
jgi:hypothetical protein